MTILTTTQAAKLVGVHPATVRRWCLYGGLQHDKLGDMYVINTAVLKDYLKNYESFRVERKPESLYISKSTMVADRQILSDDAVERNRAIIEQRIQDTMNGKIKPVYLPAGER